AAGQPPWEESSVQAALQRRLRCHTYAFPDRGMIAVATAVDVWQAHILWHPRGSGTRTLGESGTASLPSHPKSRRGRRSATQRIQNCGKRVVTWHKPAALTSVYAVLGYRTVLPLWR